MDVPYGLIAKCIKNGTVVPFLGSAASCVGAPAEVALPTGRGLANRLVGLSREDYPGDRSDPLTKVAQYLEMLADRNFLLSGIHEIFYEGVPKDYRCSVTEFLNGLPASLLPKLVVTTNYDVVLERAFEGKIPYLAISHMGRNTRYAGRLLCYDSLEASLDNAIFTKAGVEEMLHDLDQQRPGCVVIYKLHGTSRLKSDGDLLDSIVLTESDYIEFLEEDRLNRIPARILSTLRQANLLFLGYSLEDWNFRVLLQRLHRIQQREKAGERKHWAIRMMDHPDEVESKFWEKRGVNLYSLSLDVFLSKLRDKLREPLI